MITLILTTTPALNLSQSNELLYTDTVQSGLFSFLGMYASIFLNIPLRAREAIKVSLNTISALPLSTIRPNVKKSGPL